MLHPRWPWVPWRISLPSMWSTVLIGDSLFCSSDRIVMALRSTRKNCGRFTLSGVPRLHSPSAPHSVTPIGTQRSGADPSCLPAAPPGPGTRHRLAAARAVPARARSFRVFIQARGRVGIGVSAHRVAAAGHASAEGLVVVGPSLGHGALLLRR